MAPREQPPPDVAPALSVILATPYDFESTIRPVLAYLRQQTIRERLELVIVGTSRDDLGVEESALAGFHSFQILEVGPIRSTNVPRAAGIRAARAPLVALTEDHCFPDPTWAEALVRAHQGPWAAVGPTIGLANPQRMISWANYLIQYAPWVQPAPSGPMDDLPGHNSSYKKAVLESFERDLETLFIAEGKLHADLRRRGLGLYMETEAVSYHLYISRLRPYVKENYYIGRQYAANRSRDWSRWRRAVRVVAAPLVPLVRARRIHRRMREFGWQRELLPGIVPSLAVGLAASALGELVGFAAGMGDAAAQTLDLDFRRDRFVSAEERETVWTGRALEFRADPPRPDKGFFAGLRELLEPDGIGRRPTH